MGLWLPARQRPVRAVELARPLLLTRLQGVPGARIPALLVMRLIAQPWPQRPSSATPESNVLSLGAGGPKPAPWHCRAARLQPAGKLCPGLPPLFQGRPAAPTWGWGLSSYLYTETPTTLAWGHPLPPSSEVQRPAPPPEYSGAYPTPLQHPSHKQASTAVIAVNVHYN